MGSRQNLYTTLPENAHTANLCFGAELTGRNIAIARTGVCRFGRRWPLQMRKHKLRTIRKQIFGELRGTTSGDEYVMPTYPN